ncbi:MAG TPA: SufD family Fe-S cluster assembly protein, partial [Cyclobacteriaceae bacterium]|nr:SufD family Fe-S cluster assembly protein [Cyclobacteriaceae bacterium]
MSTITTGQEFKNEIINSFRSAKFGEANENRERAILQLEKSSLPDQKHEEYRFAPITKSIEKNFTWRNQVSSSQLNSIQDFLISGLEANLLVFINGSFSKSHSKIVSPASEVTVKSLHEAFQSEKSTVEKYFDKLVSSEADAYAALNTALWQEGIFIHVPENTVVEKPFFILHIHDANQEQVIAHTRILAVVEKNSELNLIEKFDSTGSNPIFTTISEEFEIKENARLEYCKIQNEQGNSHQVANTLIRQADSSSVNTFTLTLNGQLIRNNFGISIDGEHCESHFYGLYLLNDNTIADNHTVVDHKKPNSFSNEMYKGVMDGNSKGVFNGKIFVRPHAQKTNAFQSNRNILLTDTATVNTKPQLEIWADDVKCSH